MIRLFKNLSKKDWLCLLISVGFIVLQVWLDLKMPDYMSEVTMLVQTPGSEMKEIVATGGKMLLCAFGSLVSSVIVSILAAGVGSNFAAALRNRLFNKVQSFSMEEIGKFSTASLITRSTNDVTQVQMFIIISLTGTAKATV